MIGKIAMVACVCLPVTARETARPWAVSATQVMGSSRSSRQEQETLESRRKAINQQRREAMAADAEKILDLARQIRESAKVNSETPSASVLSQLESVEKLARRIKSKMQENVNLSQLKRPSGAVEKGSPRPAFQSGFWREVQVVNQNKDR